MASMSNMQLYKTQIFSIPAEMVLLVQRIVPYFKLYEVESWATVYRKGCFNEQ